MNERLIAAFKQILEKEKPGTEFVDAQLVRVYASRPPVWLNTEPVYTITYKDAETRANEKAALELKTKSFLKRLTTSDPGPTIKELEVGNLDLISYLIELIEKI